MAIAFVQKIGGNSGNPYLGTTQTITVPAAGVTAGDLILVTVMAGSTGNCSVSDSAGNVYTQDKVATESVGPSSVQVFSAPNCLALTSGQTITVTFPTNTSQACSAFEFSGVAASSPVDVSAVGNNQGATWSTASATTTNANDLLIGGHDNASGGGVTWASGWTALTGNDDLNGDQLDTAYQIVSATGAYTANGTGGSVSNAVAFVAYKGAAGGGVIQPAVPIPTVHGQWPMAPLRSTQRPALALKPGHMAVVPGTSAGAGVSENHDTTAAAEEFYGDGTQQRAGLVLGAQPHGQWPMAPLRALSRVALTTKPPGYNAGTLAGINENDLTRGLVDQFYGVVDAPGVQQPDTSVALQANAVLSQTGAQIVNPSAPLVANTALVQTAAQVVSPFGDALQANAVLAETAAQVVEPTAPLVANAVLDGVTNGAQVVDPSVPLVANALLVATGTSITPPVAAAAPPSAHGQWPMAPLRTTTRVTLTRVEHNVDVGIAASDLTYQGNCEQFYGDGTNPLPLRQPIGTAMGWAAPVRWLQRQSFVWQAHDVASAANDLLSTPLGLWAQFYGIPDGPAGTLPAQPIGGLQANAVLDLVTVGAQVVSPSGADPLVATAVLVETAAQIVEPVDSLVANAALTETLAQVVEPSAPLVANAVLTLTGAQIVALGLVLQANAVLAATGTILSSGPAVPVLYTLSDTAAAVYTLSDIAAALYTLSDIAAAVYALSDTTAAVYTLSDSAVAVYTVSDQAI